MAKALPLTPERLALPGTEHAHQCALFYWAVLTTELRPWCDVLLFAIPNGGKRDGATAAKMKAEGVKRGTADVFLSVPAQGKCGLYVELKRPEAREAGAREGSTRIKRRAGTTAPPQETFREAVLAMGYAHVVAYGWKEAAHAIACHLGRPDLAPS